MNNGVMQTATGSNKLKIVQIITYLGQIVKDKVFRIKFYICHPILKRIGVIQCTSFRVLGCVNISRSN